MINLKIRFLFIAVCVVLTAWVLFVPCSVDALGVTVKRVTFEGAKRAEVITIINNSDVEETYRLGWKHFTMSEGGKLILSPEDDMSPEVKPSKDMVRFSPRRFTLKPRASQQVRMMLRMPSGVEDGEYRSHFWIHPEENVEAYRDRDKPVKAGRAGVSMHMLAGVTMPVIVRKGELDLSVSIEDLSVSRQEDSLLTRFVITREGAKSSYGDLDYVCNRGGDEYLLKFMRGVSVYAETDRRMFSIKIPKKQDKPPCASLTVRYMETDGFAGDAIGILAEAEVPVQ